MRESFRSLHQNLGAKYEILLIFWTLQKIIDEPLVVNEGKEI